MNTEQVKQVAEKMPFEKAVSYIQSLPLSLTLIRDMTSEKLWRVENHGTIAYVSVCYKSLVTGMAQIGFINHQ